MMDCKDCEPLIPGYVDQELSEAQSGPLRQHLMDCPACRKALAGQKSLERWFASPAAEEAEVPAGFAQRVARRAFAGDRGQVESEGLRDLVLQPAMAVEGPEAPIYSFTMWATAAAAAVLLVVSGMLFQLQVGDGPNISADNGGPTKEDMLQDLDNLADPAFTENSDLNPGAALEDMSDVNTKKSEEDRLRTEKQ